MLLAAKSIGEELAKVIGLLLFGIIVAGVQWLKNRSSASSDEEPDEKELPHPRPAAKRPENGAFQTRRETPAAPPTIAAGRVPLEMLRRQSAEQGRRRQKREAEAERQSQAEQAQRLANAIQQNAIFQAGRTQTAAPPPPPVATAPRVHPIIGSVDPASLRRAIVLNEVIGQPLALREYP